MRTFFVLAALFASTATVGTAFAIPAPNTLVRCGDYRVQYLGATPHWVAGNPAKNQPSPREGWATVDGRYEGGKLFFAEPNGKRHEVKIRRDMAFQYNRYIIEADVITVPDFRPLGDLGSPVEITMTHDPVEGNSAGILGFGDEDPQCTIVHLP